MPITVNEGGILYELDTVYSNEGGTLYELDTVHSNEGGTLYEIHSGSLVNIYCTGQTSDDVFEAYEYPTGISIYRQVNTSEDMDVYIEFKGVKSGDVVRIMMNHRRDSTWRVGLNWIGATDVTSNLDYSFHISSDYIDIYGNSVNVAPCYFQFTATQDNPKIIFNCGSLDSAKPLTVSIFSIKINNVEKIKTPYTNYFSSYPIWTITKGNSRQDKSEVIANLTPIINGWKTQLSIDPGGTTYSSYSGTISAKSSMKIIGAVTKGDKYITSIPSGGTESGSVSLTIGSTTISSGNSGSIQVSLGNSSDITATSNVKKTIISGSPSGVSSTDYYYGYKATYDIEFII